MDDVVTKINRQSINKIYIDTYNYNIKIIYYILIINFKNK